MERMAMVTFFQLSMRLWPGYKNRWLLVTDFRIRQDALSVKRTPSERCVSTRVYYGGDRSTRGK